MPDLFAAHGADLAVELYLSPLDEKFRSAAGVAHAGVFHKIIKPDVFFIYNYLFHLFCRQSHRYDKEGEAVAVDRSYYHGLQTAVEQYLNFICIGIFQSV